MRDRGILAWVLLLFVGLALPGAASAQVELSETAGKPFPNKTYLMSLPSRQALTTNQTVVTENDQPVSDLRVYPNTQSGKTKFGTVLVIDASSSMHDEAIKSAMSAARAFARRRDPRQPLGIVLFSSSPQVLLPLTTDQAKINNALGTTPAVAEGTHIYDAVQQATTMLKTAGVAAGAIVVLSDGTDTGSAASLQQVTAAAGAAHLRVYSVGLRTRAFNRTTLISLASAANGRYTTATSGQVADLYGRLGNELANQYLISYRSTATLGSPVRVSVHVVGVGRAQDDYFAPALPPAAIDGPAKKSFWESTAATWIVVGLVALLMALAILALLAPRDSLRNRVGRFVSIPDATDERAWSLALVERALGEGKRRGQRRRLTWLAPSAEDLELARIGLSRAQILLLTVVGTVVIAVFLAIQLDSVLGVLLALFFPYLVRVFVRIQLDRQRRLFDSQLPDNLGVIASAMRAGHTFLGALGTVVVDAPEPSRRELRRVLADEQLGVPLADALNSVANRMGSSDFEHVALVATLQSETGGNTAEVIDQVAENIRERQDLRRLISTLTAQGRLAGFVVAGLPVVLLIVISIISPDYLHPLFHRPAGIAMLVTGTIMLALGASIIRRIVNIDV